MLEQEIFKKSKPIIEEIVKYGFKKKDNKYIYETTILNTFKVVLTLEKEITGKLYDTTFDNEEYTTFRIKDNNGSFSNKVKEEYEKLLKNIKENCFKEEIFIYNQTNRITEYIIKKYNSQPRFEWDDENAVFKNIKGKWFGIIMNINKNKLGKENIKVEIINVKLDPEKIKQLITEKGYYPAYHMNKKNWITIILDDTLEDEIIQKLIDESYELVTNKNYKTGD